MFGNKRPLLQLSLQDLMFIVVLAAMAVLAITPQVVTCIEQPTLCKHHISVRAKAIAAVAILIISNVGAFVGLAYSNFYGHRGIRRNLCILCACAAPVGCAAFIAIPSIFRSRMTSAELLPAAACKAFAEGEEIFHRTDWDSDGIPEYSPWLGGVFENNGAPAPLPNLIDHKTAGDYLIACVDRAFANATGPLDIVTPKFRYVFKVLRSGRTKNGIRSYMTPKPDGSGEDMTEGYAIIAAPVMEYSDCGCFMISNEGTIYEADFGDNNLKVFEETTTYDPDPKHGWKPVE